LLFCQPKNLVLANYYIYHKYNISRNSGQSGRISHLKPTIFCRNTGLQIKLAELPDNSAEILNSKAELPDCNSELADSKAELMDNLTEIPDSKAE